MSAPRVVDSAAQPVSGVGLSADAPLAVARFISHLDKRIREKVVKQGYWLTGDVVELRHGGRGALYFELCDHGTRVSCVVPELFSSRALSVLANGQRAVVFANVDLDDRDGRVRLSVTDVQDHGVGAEQRRLARLRETLQREGLFKAERKRRIPERPAAIALITSESGAGRHDFVAAARRRHPGMPIVLIPTAMQGPTAPQAIIEALRRATRTSCTLVVLARGGGAKAPIASVFNDESLVRVVADPLWRERICQVREKLPADDARPAVYPGGRRTRQTPNADSVIAIATANKLPAANRRRRARPSARSNRREASVEASSFRVSVRRTTATT